MKPWRPANTFEGMAFMESFCDRCIHDAEYSDEHPERGCPILAQSMLGQVDEWVETEGKRKCMKFQEK